MKTCFLRKLFKDLLSIFLQLKNFPILQKNIENTVERTYFDIISFDTHCTANKPLYRFWKNYIGFYSKKNPNFVRFEKSYYFSHILRQTCYKFVMKTFNSPNCQFRTLTFGGSRECNNSLILNPSQFRAWCENWRWIYKFDGWTLSSESEEIHI